MLEHGFRTLVPEADALRRLRAAIRPLVAAEMVAIDAADGRVVAEDLHAPRDAPHYARSAMDGFAVRARDTAGASVAGPVTLAVSDVAGRGTAVRVHTGSVLPTGADAVVPLEDGEVDGPRVHVTRRIREGEHVGARGEDVRAGDRVVAAGHVLRPPDLGLLRALGIERLALRPRPRVSVLVTGEELVPAGAEPGPGTMVDGNGLMLAGAVSRWGGLPRVEAHYTDRTDSLAPAFGTAAGRSDLVVTSGGTSVGVRDRVVEALATSGVVWFHGVAIQPARPVAAGVVDGTPFLCLPGFPVAAFVAAFALLRPTLDHLAGAQPGVAATLRGALSRKIPSTLGLRTYARVAFRDGRVDPVRASGAGLLSTLVRADGFVVVPEDTEGLPEGSLVDVLPFA